MPPSSKGGTERPRRKQVAAATSSRRASAPQTLTGPSVPLPSIRESPNELNTLAALAKSNSKDEEDEGENESDKDPVASRSASRASNRYAPYPAMAPIESQETPRSHIPSRRSSTAPSAHPVMLEPPVGAAPAAVAPLPLGSPFRSAAAGLEAPKSGRIDWSEDQCYERPRGL